MSYIYTRIVSVNDSEDCTADCNEVVIVYPSRNGDYKDTFVDSIEVCLPDGRVIERKFDRTSGKSESGYDYGLTLEILAVHYGCVLVRGTEFNVFIWHRYGRVES